MQVSLVTRDLLVQMFYEHKENASATIRLFRRIKKLWNGKCVHTMTATFEVTEKLEVQPSRDRKPFTPEVVDVLKTFTVKKSQKSDVGGNSARKASPEMMCVSKTKKSKSNQ